MLQEREREREKEKQIVDGYILMLKQVFNQILVLVGTPPLILAWNKTLKKTSDKYPFLKDIICQTEIEERLWLISEINRSIRPSMVIMDDLDVNKLYTKLPNIEEEEMIQAFEELLTAFYDIGKVLFGTAVKFPLTLELEEKG